MKEQGGFLETLKELCKRGAGRSLSHLGEPSLRKQHQCMQASGESSEHSRLPTTRSKERSEIQLQHRPQGFSRDEADVATDEAMVSDGQSVRLTATVAKEGTAAMASMEALETTQHPWELEPD